MNRYFTRKTIVFLAIIISTVNIARIANAVTITLYSKVTM